MEWKWERLDDRTSRAKVPGGWLVNHRSSASVSDMGGSSVSIGDSMCFIPDPNHEWTIESEAPDA